MDLREIKTLLLGQLEEVLTHLLPSGKRTGNYYCVGSVDGEEGKSLRVCLSGSRRGVWTDGATGEADDIIGLWKSVRGADKARDIIPELKEYLNLKDHHDAPSRTTRKRYEKPKEDYAGASSAPLDYLVNERGISMGTLDVFEVASNSHGNAIIFPYYDMDSELCLLKFIGLERDEKGRKKVWASKGGKPVLFGLGAAPVFDADRFIVICEGEIDALSYYEQGIPAVSVPFGAKGENTDGTSANDEWIEHCHDWLSGFDCIYLSMDQDHEGEAAATALMKRLGRERCRIVKMPYKDANEALLEGAELSTYLSEARTVDPDDMMSAMEKSKSVWDVIRGGVREKKGVVPLGLPEDLFPFRLRPREGTIITGYGGFGKSNFVYQLTAWLAGQGERVFIGSYEEPADEILGIMATHVLGRKLQRNEHQIFSRINDVVFSNIFVHDYEGIVPVDKFFEYAEYAVKCYGVSYVILDSLTTTDVDLDDKDSIARFSKQSQAFWKRTGCHLIVIAHPRKRENEKCPPLKADIKGGGHLGDLFFNVLTVHRPDEEERPRHDTELIVSKQKVGGQKPRLKLYFDRGNYRLYLDMDDHENCYANLDEDPF